MDRFVQHRAKMYKRTQRCTQLGWHQQWKTLAEEYCAILLVEDYCRMVVFLPSFDLNLVAAAAVGGVFFGGELMSRPVLFLLRLSPSG